jgi:PKD repeat protein
VSFDGSSSHDPDGDTLSYSWNFGDGTSVIGAASTTHSYAASGTYAVLLTVTDTHSGVNSTSRTMTVAAAVNLPPTASFTRSPTSGVAPLSVNVDATGTTDPNGDPLTYVWSWGDGTANGSGVNATHSYASAATYTITLTAKDTSNASSTATSTVVVSPLNCDVTSGSFKNPSTNGASNDVHVGSNNKPVDNSFTFYATSNTACASISARIPDASGIWSVDLTATGTVGGVVSWQGTASFINRDKFNTGSAQTGEFWSPGSSGTADKFSFSFNVHT